MKEKALLEGVILRGVGGIYTVACGDTQVCCHAGGRLRREAAPLAVGDRVELELTGEAGYILSRKPRKNALLRPAIANIDQLLIFASEAPPVTDPYLIDQVTVAALRQDIAPVLLLNKSDLSPSNHLWEAYEKAGFPVIRISAVTGEGMDALKAQLRGKISAFTGNSGIGKSSVLNRLDEGFALEIGEISEKIARGKHTTRQVELLSLEGGALVADTPGFSTFDVTRMGKIEKEELAAYFPEMRDFFGQCRFSDCTHRAEPDCAIRSAAEAGTISRSRYESYQKLYEVLAQQKSWLK